MLAIPPFGASSNIALWRANIKPPVELVVDDLEERGAEDRLLLFSGLIRLLYNPYAFVYNVCDEP